MRSALFIAVPALAAILALSGLAAPAGVKGRKTEQQYLDAVREQAKLGNAEGVRKESAEFFRLYPESTLIPDVRLELAEFETSPDKSIARYRVLVDKYRYYGKRDYALLRICEIEFLLAKWNDLCNDARAGLGPAAGGYRNDFRFFLIVSLIRLGDYDEAQKECRALIEADHDYNNMARSLLILAHIHKNTSGLSREYITAVRELAVGYGRSDALPAALYLLGEFYERKGMIDESYSAYSDLAAKFPGSPEAAKAARHIDVLKTHAPRRVEYLPGKKIVESTESIDIRPETDLPEDNRDLSFFSISVGPFASVKSANGIRAVLKNFNFLKTVRLKNGYALYVGKSSDEESAMRLKIRLAEEYGINGRIVRISGDGQRSYIYGE